MVAFLLTDVEGSTRLWEEHDETMAAALELHDAILRATIADHGGYVFSTAGDAFAAAFGECADAAAAAAGVQQQLAAAAWPTPQPIAVRIGLHVGAAHERDGDYFGPTLNRTARIMAAAHGGQTLASAAFVGLLGSERHEDLHDLGLHRLKDLQSPEHIWQLGDGDHPPLRTLDVVRHNLPVERTQLFGRAPEVAHLADLLADHRLVTLLGIGGTGKTRVATAVAAEVADSFGDGVWFVDLVPVTDAAGVATAIADASGLQVRGTDVSAGLSEVLASKRALFVVDNCEHVTDAVADVLDHLLTHTAEPRFLATSREPLELFDETLLALEPLQVGDARSPAVQLFVDAADRVGRRPDDRELATVGAICTHLDGHPLSIELAAAQLKQLSVTQLAERLDHRFELLARGSRGRRHESLLAILDDTWNLLAAEERAMLLQLAAFPSDFGVEAVEAVCADLDVGLPSRTLGALSDHSLVTTAGDGRHRLLETIKLFVRRRWDDDTPFERHEQWMLSHLGAQPHEARYTSGELSEWLVAHVDDWQAIERRLASGRRWDELAELHLRSHILFNSRLSGPWAIEALARIERRLAEDGETMEPRCRAALNLSAAQLGLPTRRPDWITIGSQAAVELLSDTPGVDLAYAMVLRSWSLAMSAEIDAAVDLLDDAFAMAEAHGAPAVANVALGYKANHLGVSRRGDEAREVLAHLGARLEPGMGTYGHWLHAHVGNAVNIVCDPPSAVVAANALLSQTAASTVLVAATIAASGDLTRALELFEVGIANAEEIYGDDGFPDLLLPPAAAAYAAGEHDRARMLLTAVRRAPKPTQNFLATIQYRELRDSVGLSDENPLDHQSLQEILDEAHAWFREAAGNV